jgi:Putative auto-transporter adhesin, head GIN domain
MPKHTLLLMPILFTVSACGQAESTPGPGGSRNFDASGFDKVKLAGSDDVRVVIGPTFAVSATGPQKILDALDIRVEGGTLKVSRETRMWSFTRGSAVVTVTMPAIKGASLEGSGNLDVAQAKGAAFEASLGGSGNLSVGRVAVDALNINLAGSGDVKIAGSTKAIDVSLAGSGDVDASETAAEQASISIAGSGNVDARASRGASVSILGSGDVTITGTTNCQTSKLGSGNVTCNP